MISIFEIVEYLTENLIAYSIHYKRDNLLDLITTIEIIPILIIFNDSRKEGIIKNNTTKQEIAFNSYLTFRQSIKKVL